MPTDVLWLYLAGAVIAVPLVGRLMARVDRRMGFNAPRDWGDIMFAAFFAALWPATLPIGWLMTRQPKTIRAGWLMRFVFGASDHERSR